jgi:hypothetical protein
MLTCFGGFHPVSPLFDDSDNKDPSFVSGG